MDDAASRPGEVVRAVERVRVGKLAHGGHWVAKAADGRVLFVRGALEGELVTVEVTSSAKRHAFARVLEVLEPSDDRVEAPCPIADRCGGCDFQHVRLGAQAELKRHVVAEQLERLAGIAWDGTVETLTPVTRWRTRVRYHADAAGWGMHPVRSNDVVPLPDQGCLIAAPGLAKPPTDVRGDTARGVQSAEGVHWLRSDADVTVREEAAGRSWAVRGDGFWQVHHQAADTLVEAVLAGLEPRPGERAFDFYCGVGLFAGALVDAGVRVVGIEGSRTAVQLAEANVPEARFVAGSVDKQLGRLPSRCDLIVLDPPRVGAGKTVMDAIGARRPRAVAYVACDPASLGRDVGYALKAGWEVESLRAFDLFGMTHHVECVAILHPVS